MFNSAMLTLVHQKYLLAVSLGSFGFAAAAAGEPIIFSAMGRGPYLTYSNTIPTWIVVGENESNDLEDSVQGWKWWQKYYARFEERFRPAWKTERQPEPPITLPLVRKPAHARN